MRDKWNLDIYELLAISFASTIYEIFLKSTKVLYVEQLLLH